MYDRSLPGWCLFLVTWLAQDTHTDRSDATTARHGESVKHVGTPNPVRSLVAFLLASNTNTAGWQKHIGCSTCCTARYHRTPSLQARCKVIVLCSISDSQSEVASNLTVRPARVRYRARLMYDGEEFLGMQWQANRKSIAYILEAVLHQRMQANITLHHASRTDAGVHARGQAIHFDLPPRDNLPAPSQLEHSLNRMLPKSVRVIHMERAPEVDEMGRPWHCRFCAIGKFYVYRLYSGKILDPLMRRQRHHAAHSPLDLDAMKQAAEHLQGWVDCAAFANRGDFPRKPLEMGVENTTRLVRRITILDEGNGNVRLEFHIQSALYRMIRNMVGLLIEVGKGLISASDVPRLIESRDRHGLPGPAPAHGLTLEDVYYAVGWDEAYKHPLHVEMQ